jgi:methylamine--corrinoid protein Co-methyltransferase
MTNETNMPAIDLPGMCPEARLTGPVSEESFNLDRVYSSLVDMAKKHDITFDPAVPVPADDALADRVFAAALDFFVECGVYYQDTETVLEYSRETVLSALDKHNGDCHFGQGDEAGVLRSRRPDSNTRPWCHVGSGIVASNEEICSQIVFGNASIPEADSMSVNALDRFEGHWIVAGGDNEVPGAVRSLEIARESINRAGRQGLAIINGIATAASAKGTIEAAAAPGGLQPGDGIIVGTYAEFRTNSEMMAKVRYSLDSNTKIVLASAPMLGGFAGGPEGVAILNTAYAILGVLVYRCNYYLSLPLHISSTCSTTRDVTWATAVSSQALARNTNMPTLTLAYVAGGPWTESFYYESAAFIAASIASGVSTQTPHPAKAVLPDYVTPLEMRTTNDIALACAGMNRREANRVVKALLDRYEDGLTTAPQGRSYTECYDLDTGIARQEYVDFVNGIRNELSGTGIPLSDS